MAAHKITTVLAIALVLSGCAGSPAQIYGMSPDQIQEVAAFPLCNAYAVSNQSNEKIRAELKRRDEVLSADPSYSTRAAFTDREWNAIQGRQIFLGMSESALVCSWGMPGLHGDVNASVGSWGTHRQWVYRSCDYCSGQYVYTENGFVTSWQN